MLSVAKLFLLSACMAVMLCLTGAFAPTAMPLQLRKAAVSCRPTAPLRMSSEEAQPVGDRVAEIKEVLVELEDFRERIVGNAKDLAKKVKAKPKDLKAALEDHPDLKQIDAAKEQLEAELKQLETA
mmetsp:Transcript_54450/g.128494  ORF Transcript_54450/g.128494 Transcript_54450/m.128494 type:complete len:126 (-) Transcript_54450:48-425(-)|eukprot:3594504-Rhodomonas_salina.1